MPEDEFYEFTVTTHLLAQGTTDLKALGKELKSRNEEGWELVKPLVPLFNDQGTYGFMAVWRKTKQTSEQP